MPRTKKGDRKTTAKSNTNKVTLKVTKQTKTVISPPKVSLAIERFVSTRYEPSPGITLSVLFVPFDAAIQHYRRNAKNGVEGVEQSTNSKLASKSTFEVEESGTAMSKDEIDDSLSDIIESACRELRTDDPIFVMPSEVREYLKEAKRTGRKVPISIEKKLADLRRGVASYPELLFLSEQPKGVTFPQTLMAGKYVSYHQIGVTVTTNRATQKIYAYVRGDRYNSEAHAWKTISVTKWSASGQEEHLLVVRYKCSGVSCVVAGAHLSAKNVSASSTQQSREMTELRDFCKEKGVQFVIGDFNMDMSTHGGGVGGRFGSMVVHGDVVERPLDFTYLQQFTNSTNNKHFMGYYIADKLRVRLDGVTLRQHVGLSLSRSLDGEYFSDHAPIYVTLRITE